MNQKNLKEKYNKKQLYKLKVKLKKWTNENLKNTCNTNLQ